MGFHGNKYQISKDFKFFAKIGICDQLVIGNHSWRTVSDLDAVLQHQDSIAELHDQTHEMLNNQDRRTLVTNFEYQSLQVGQLVWGKPGGRFIEQQQFWGAGKGARQV